MHKKTEFRFNELTHVKGYRYKLLADICRNLLIHDRCLNSQAEPRERYLPTGWPPLEPGAIAPPQVTVVGTPLFVTPQEWVPCKKRNSSSDSGPNSILPPPVITNYLGIIPPGVGPKTCPWYCKDQAVSSGTAEVTLKIIPPSTEGGKPRVLSQTL